MKAKRIESIDDVRDNITKLIDTKKELLFQFASRREPVDYMIKQRLKFSIGTLETVLADVLEYREFALEKERQKWITQEQFVDEEGQNEW